MKVTAWTNEEYARKHYRDLFEERLALSNPNKHMLSPNELKELAESKKVPYNDEFVNNYLEEYKKIPTYTNEEKAEEYSNILKEIEKCIIKHCKKTNIRFGGWYHQYGDYGVPIIDDEFMYLGFARTWGWIMAMADGDKSEKGYLKYYLHMNEHPTKYPNEVKNEKLLK